MCWRRKINSIIFITVVIIIICIIIITMTSIIIIIILIIDIISHNVHLLFVLLLPSQLIWSGVIHILCMQKNHIFRLPHMLHCVYFVDPSPMCTYKFTLPHPDKIVVLTKPHSLKFKLDLLRHKDAAGCLPDQQVTRCSTPSVQSLATNGDASFRRWYCRWLAVSRWAESPTIRGQPDKRTVRGTVLWVQNIGHHCLKFEGWGD